MNSRLFRVVVIVLLVAGAIALAIWLYRLLSEPAEPTRTRAVQQIELLKPPPPPPPPKTPPPPPPPQEQQKIDAPKPDAPPEQPSEAPPPGPTSALPGNGDGDNFGLPPGDGRTSIGPVGPGGNPFAWYGALVKDRITDAVARDPKLREAGEYQRVVNVWVSNSGLITRVELVGGGSSPELDEALRLALRNLPAVREGAPADMPQPIRLRISTRS